MGLKLKNLCSCRMLASAPIGECCCHLLSVLMNAAIYFLRAIGPVCIVAGMSMISTVVYTYTTFIFPEYLSYSNGFFMFNPHCIVATISALHIYGNYLLCAFTPAGSPPQTKCDSSAIFGKRVSIVDGKKIIIGNMERLDISAAVSYRYCKHCRCVKPPRARHCSISGKCILNFDHYCPWMNNAIGIDTCYLSLSP